MPAGECHQAIGSGTFRVRSVRHARHSRLIFGAKLCIGGTMTPGEGMESFRYVVMAARRARQLQNGSQPLIDSRSTKACRVAQDEIAAGKVKAAVQQLPVIEPEIV